MSKLKELKDSILNTSIPLSSILLRAKLLAKELGNEDFHNWLNSELEGYTKADSSLPVYRQIPCNSIGTFSAGFGLTISKFQIPTSLLPEEMQPFTSHLYMTDPISAIESHLESDSKEMHQPWPGDWIAQVQTEILEGYSLVKAWKPVSRGHLKSILNTVRNRLLDFAIELDKRVSDSDEIRNNELQLLSDEIEEAFQEGIIEGSEKIPRIFISHSSRDQELAESVTDLLQTALKLHGQDIRCTSVEGHRLPGGVDTDDRLLRELLGVDAFIGLLSIASMDSAYVLFELGARWGASRYLVPLLAPDADPNIIRGPLKGKNALSCESASQLHQLIREVAEKLNIDPEPPEVFQRKIEKICDLRTKEDDGDPVSFNPEVVDNPNTDSIKNTQEAVASWAPTYSVLTKILEIFNETPKLTVYQLIAIVEQEHPDYTMANLMQYRSMLEHHGYLIAVDRDNFIPGRSISHLFDWIYDK